MLEICPCKDCIDRKVGCHSVCVKYIQWVNKKDELAALANKQRGVQRDLAAHKQMLRKKMRWGCYR